VATNGNNKPEALAAYCTHKAAGKSNKEALALAGCGHILADLAWYADDRNPRHTPYNPAWAKLATPEAQAKWVAQQRQAGLSWGQISVATGNNPLAPQPGAVTEATVRKLFAKATGLASEGLRKGRGGRWLAGEQRFYLGNRRGFGVQHQAPRTLNPDEVAATANQAEDLLRTMALLDEAKPAARKRTAQPRKRTKRTK
jgi:hypothetical protein